jgi:peptidase S41-like protein
MCVSAAGLARAAEPERVYTPAELRADFDQLYRQLRAAHFDLYAYVSERKLQARFEAARAELNQPMTADQARVKFQLFAAQVRMGHTRAGSAQPQWREYRKAGGRAFPLGIRIVDGRCYVAENLSNSAAIVPGDEILALNGERISRWLERTERHVSAESGYMAHSLMEYDFPIYLWLELGAVEAFDLEIRSADGKRHTLRLNARTREEMEKTRASQPPTLNLEEPLREARMLDAHVAYLRPGPFYNAEATTAVEQWDNSGFRAFIDKSFADFTRAGADRLIIDLRGNPGGDNLFSDVMVAWIATRPFRFASQFKIKVSEESIAANAARIAEDAAAAGPISQKFAALYAKARVGDVVDFDIPLTPPRAEGTFKGKVFALVDRQTYSNAVAVAATIQDYQFGVVLGEETSDLATTYGAMEQFKLANTGISVGYPKARIVRPSGDLRARGVVPDIRIRIPVVQTPEDEVLRRAVEISTQAVSLIKPRGPPPR